MVDKNLFLYDLAVVTSMKSDAPYVKEWLDYHLLAGVDHFYIYDNESTDNFKEIIKDYIEKNIVTIIPISVWQCSVPAYNEATQKFKFSCRYIAYLDSDEFIFPKENKSTADVLDEIFSKDPRAGGVLLNWHCFGSNNQDTADYSLGVLERFTRRAENDWYIPLNESKKLGLNAWIGNIHVKTIANPRRIDYFISPHFANYFSDTKVLDEDGISVESSFIKFPVKEKKIVLNHYYTKSREEFFVRRPGSKSFSLLDRNEIYDDGILKYRDARRAALIPQGGGGVESLFARKQINPPKLFNALVSNLITTTVATLPKNFYVGKIENFLTCLHLSAYLRGKLFDDEGAKIFEELSLNALYKSMAVGSSIADILLLIDELPKILELNYPAVKKIRDACINIIPQIIQNLSKNNHLWKDVDRFEYILKILKANH